MKSLVFGAALAAATIVGGAASAWTVVDSGLGNDCSGVYGQGFNDCVYDGSPVIAKFNGDGSLDEIATAFPSITGAEFTVMETAQGEATFTYTPGAGDPFLTYVVAKGGSGFINYKFDVGDYVNGVYSGVIYTPINPANGKNFGLSHVTFYDTGNLPPVSGIPVPATLPLLLTGLLGTGLIARRRRS